MVQALQVSPKYQGCFFSLVSFISPPEGCIDEIDTRGFTYNARFSKGLGMFGNATEIY